jgi:hypothetical protein
MTLSRTVRYWDIESPRRWTETEYGIEAIVLLEHNEALVFLEHKLPEVVRQVRRGGLDSCSQLLDGYRRLMEMTMPQSFNQPPGHILFFHCFSTPSYSALNISTAAMN